VLIAQPYSIQILEMFPLDQIADVGVNLKLFSCKIIFEVFQPMRLRYLNVTDGQIDGQTADLACNTMLCIASCSKSEAKTYYLLRA